MGNRGSTGKSWWQGLRQNFSDSFAQDFVYKRSASDADQPDRIVEQRGRDAYRYILLLLALILVPIAIHNIYIAQRVPAVASIVLLLILLANIGLLTWKRQAFLPPTMLLFMSLALVVLSVFQGQKYSLYWLYPLLAALPVLLQTRWAVVLGVLSALVLAPLLFVQFDRNTSTVLFFSMIFTWLVSAWLVYAVTEQSQRLKDMAITDPLTGAYNRRFLQARAHQTLEAWQRYQTPAAMLLIDIDFFKRVNDQYGHAFGDTAIQRLVEVISARARGVDTVCRFGGEEFVVLLNDTSIDAAARVAEELRDLVEKADILPRGTMTVSIGVCDVAEAGGVDHWFRMTDAALYQAKTNGRNRVEIASTSMELGEPLTRAVPNWR